MKIAKTISGFLKAVGIYLFIAFISSQGLLAADPLEREILTHLMPVLKYSDLNRKVETVSIQSLGQILLEIKYSDFRTDGQAQQVELTGIISFIQTDEGRKPVKGTDIFRMNYDQQGRLESLKATQRQLGFEEIIADEISLKRDPETGEIQAAVAKLPRELVELFDAKSIETLTSIERKKTSDTESILTLSTSQRLTTKATPAKENKAAVPSETKEIPSDKTEMKVKDGLVIELRSEGNAQDPRIGIEKRSYNKKGLAVLTQIYQQKQGEEPVLFVEAKTTFNSKGLPEKDVIEQKDPELLKNIPEEFRASVAKTERSTAYTYRK